MVDDLGFFWSVNARSLSSDVVAKSFIPPIQFPTILRPSNTLIVGPRGSGKTTLLKMLTLDALRSRLAGGHTEGRGLGYIGVFIPTDISWAQQLNSFRQLGLNASVVEHLLETTFATSVQRSLVDATIQRLRTPSDEAVFFGLREVETETETEVEVALARALAGAWRLDIPLPSLLGVRAALSLRQNDVAQLALHLRGSAGQPSDLPSYIGRPLLGELSAGLDAMEAAYPALAGQHWALLFDELEIAPAEIRNRVLAAMRSIDDRLLFKVALSPYSEDMSLLRSAVSAMPGHDHDEVSLSYGRKESGYEFTLDLMQAILRARAYPADDLIAVFGESTFPIDTGLTARFRSIERRGESLAKQARYVNNLFGKDRSFRRYVQDAAGGGVDDLLALERAERAQKLRKVLPLIIVRAAFRVADDSKAKGRRRYSSRKNPDIYGGLVSLAAILEGNPRWIIGVMNALLESSPGTSISAELQTREIQRTANRFTALLATIPVAALSGSRERGLVAFIRTIGNYFRERVIADDFNPDPVGSFIVDSQAPEEVINIVAAALNNGALVHVPEAGGSAVLSAIRGKRFRLSYLLATQYGLPLRLEREISLGRILESKAGLDEEALF